MKSDILGRAWRLRPAWLVAFDCGQAVSRIFAARGSGGTLWRSVMFILEVGVSNSCLLPKQLRLRTRFPYS